MSIRAAIAVLVAIFCWGRVIEAVAGTKTVYSNDFRDHYPKVGQRLDLSPYQLEAAAVIWDSAHERKITIQRTRGDRYGYEQQKCVLTAEGGGLKSARFLSVLGFRSVEASWVTGKLIAIKLGIGHVAGVDAIYDAEADKLIYCESATYLTSTNENAYRPENPRQADEARPPSPVAQATGPGGGTKQADGTRAALSNSVPLYVHFGVGFEPSKRLLYTRIHLGEPISVGGDDSWELTGEIEERGTNLVANLKGSDGVQAGFYRGTVKPERAVHVQGAIFSGGVYSMWFVVSTNTDSQPVLQRVEETGEPFTNHYTLVRPEKGAEWQLDKAWRADPQGRTVKEWPVTNPTTQKPLLLAPGDMLRLVSTSINDPLDHSEALIDPEGDVSLALHVKVHVAGLTLPEAAAVIQKAYQPSYFREWKFTVIRVPVAQLQPVPRGQAPSFVFTEGEFKNPGRYPWTNGMTLKDGIDAANGFTDYARRSLRIRHWDGSEERYRLGAGRTLTNNPALKPGDYVISPRAEW